MDLIHKPDWDLQIVEGKNRDSLRDGRISLYYSPAGESVAFPLTLTLSPKEREQPKRHSRTQDARQQKAGHRRSSPQGRGRGEGKQVTEYSYGARFLRPFAT